MAEEHLDFPQFFRIILKRFWVIVLITLTAVLTSAFLSYYVLTPVYQAKVNMLVNTQYESGRSAVTSNTDESLKLVTTYEDIVQSPFILKNAQLKLNTEGHNIAIERKKVSVEHTDESQVFGLLVEDTDATEATLIANAIATTFDEHIKSVMNTKVKQVKVLNNAAVDPDPISPQPWLIIGSTFIISFIFSIWITLLIHNVKRSRKPS